MKNDKQAAKGVSQLPGAPTAADPRYQARGTDMTTEGSSQDNGHLESPEAEWINTLLDDFTYSGRDGSDYGTDDAKEDRKWLKQTILTKLTEAREQENDSFKSIFEEAATWAPKCYNHEKPSSYCHACKKRKWFADLSKEVIPIIDERLEQLKASKEDS